MGSKIFLASVYSSKKCYQFDIPKQVLESFFYVKKAKYEDFKKFLVDLGEDNFLLDSGAFTFLNSSKKQINLDEYVDDYITFINKFNIKYFFELDLDIIIGYEKVKEIRKYIEQKTNKKTIPVWHKTRGLDEFKKMSLDYDYIAIGGLALKTIKKNEYKYLNRLIKIAHENNCKVHGLGFTPMNILKYNFDTTDSTSWKIPARTGNIIKFKDNEIKTLHTKIKDKKIIQKKVVNNSIKEWGKFVKYVEKN